MKNIDLGIKIKELRTRKAFSQEELAQQAGISLRTIQRIENDETKPRGDTLIRLAAALNTTPDELAEKPEPGDKKYIALLNLSALTFIAFPLLGILIPLIIWVLNKSKVKHIDETGKKLLNFQISWCIAFLLIIVLAFTGKIRHISLFGLGAPESELICIYGFYLVNILFIVGNTIRALNSRSVFYQPALPFIR
jgi:transcriptional regulator with XRE-family HTH domain